MSKASVLKKILNNDPNTTRASFNKSLNLQEVQQLAEGIESNTHLVSLDLTDCRFENVGESLKLLADAFKNNKTITDIDIEVFGNDSDEIKQFVAEILEIVEQNTIESRSLLGHS